MKSVKTAQIPMKTIGPVNIKGTIVNEEVSIPLATFETPLWPSVQRGARISMQTEGIQAHLIQDGMTRSILFEANAAADILTVIQSLPAKKADLKQVVEQTSRFAVLQDWHSEPVGNLLYLRLNFNTGDAAGHNMATKAAEAVMNWLLTEYDQLNYVSISGNLCADKKVSAINGILGRGKHVVAEIVIPKTVCEKTLKTTPDAIVALNNKKNLIGSTLAGSIRSANAHFANMLQAFYLATGQDAANIVEGSQGITYAAIKDDALYFSVTLPNLILGTVGNGKALPFVQENLALMGCSEPTAAGQNARRLAIICAASVLCGELSLLAAQTNCGELMKSHERLERLSRG